MLCFLDCAIWQNLVFLIWLKFIKFRGGYLSVMRKCRGNYVGKIRGYLVYCEMEGEYIGG